MISIFSERLILYKRILLIFILFQTVIWGDLLPGFYNISADSTNPIFVVDKAKQMFYIFHSSGPGRITALDSIKASTGTIRGDKKIEGDKKTPEGVYTITNEINEDRLPEIYGPLALILDYPNTVDRIRGNGGTNIWMHGRNEKLAPRQTEGCVSLENHSILEVNEKFVKLGETKIIIYDSLESKNVASYHQELKTWEAKLKGWRDAWQFGDFDKYRDYYGAKFQDYKTLDGYVARKKRIDNNTAWKKINTENAKALVADYEARILFEQEYITPGFISLGQKELTLMKSDNKWKIVSEDFHPLQRQTDFMASINNFVTKWEKSEETNAFDNTRMIISNVSAGLDSDTIYSAFELTTLGQDTIREGRKKLYLDYENAEWHLISKNYNKRNEYSLSNLQTKFTKKWLQSWNAGEMDEYLELYSRNNFSTDDGGYNHFAKSKRRLDNLYAWVDVELENITSKITGENIKISFLQNYNCPRFISRGKKELLLAREPQGWKIISETFESIKKEEIKPKLIDFVNSWQQAWESGEIDHYIDYYATEFESGDFDRESWYEDKKEKFQNSNQIVVKTSNYRIKSPRKYVWRVVFDQSYQSGSYSDEGNKLLVIKGKPGNFKIINEKWWQ